MEKKKRYGFNLYLLALFFVLFLFCPFSSQAAEQEKEIPDFTEKKTISIPEPNLENRGTAEQVQTFSTSSYTGKYGDQLTGKSATLYKEMVKNYYTNKKTGNLKLSNKLTLTFKATVKNGKPIENAAFNAAIDSFTKTFIYARDAFFEDYPEVFWIYNFNDVDTDINIYKNSSYSTGYQGKIILTKISPVEFFPGASKLISNYNKGVAAAVKKIKASINNSTNRLKIYKAIHDYVCNRVDYDDMAVTYSNYDDFNYAHTSANAFISKPYSYYGTRTMVCEGYAEVFKVLCDAFGLDDYCACIVGTAYTDYNKSKNGAGGHEWNYVKLYQKWYLVDTTWDDGKDSIDYTYYLSGKKDIGYTGLALSEERKLDYFFNEESCTFKLASLSSTSYTTDTYGKSTAKLAFKEKELTKTYGTKEFKNPLAVKTTNGDLTYVSSNPKVAAVTSTGKIKIKGVGKCKIAVYSAITKEYGPASASYKITVNPATTSLTKVSNIRIKKVTIKWKKVSCTSYQIQYSTDKNFVKSVKTQKVSSSKTSYTMSSLSKNKTYYVRIRAYQSSNKLYGKWSSIKKIKIVR